MVDFKFIAERIKKIVLKRGYSVDPTALEERLKNDEQRLRFYKQVFSTSEGRWVLMDLMQEGGLLASIDTDNPIKIAQLEGKRQIATYIAGSLALTFDQVIQSYADLGKYNDS